MKYQSKFIKNFQFYIILQVVLKEVHFIANKVHSSFNLYEFHRCYNIYIDKNFEYI